ncbi:protocadherin Fat 1-like [Mercenaria mercenaria]|uniref:protocadherin Fat 1-like n=1 Tax=Mercenaria mercenaria TaxID=6596 RepID=UPI00234F05F0|nr:protocadherin Fat 1-like [Mercenaria mercenaria]
MRTDRSIMFLMILALPISADAAITSWSNPSIPSADGNGVISVSEGQSTFFIFTTITAVSDATLVQYVYTVQASPISVLTGGEVQITSTLDFETTSSYTIVVEVIDNEPATGTATITVSVTDVNEAAPAFDQNTFSACIADGSTTDTTLTTTLATDQDTSNTVTHSFAGGNTNNDFKIDANTGLIQVNSASLTSSVTASYDLVVEAVDDGSPILTGTTTVSVTVGDCSRATKLVCIAMTIIVPIIVIMI